MTLLQAVPMPVTLPTCAALTDSGGACPQEAHVPCPKCLLVAYCDVACRTRHWNVHKLDCNKHLDAKLPTLSEASDDLAEGISFWCRNAAADVLQLGRNEGRYFDDRLDLLFAGEFGLRHFIYSVGRMPESAAPQFFVALNEPTDLHFARSFIALHLLCASDRDPVVNAEAVLHMWYSARMPQRLHDYIRSVVRDHVGAVFDDAVFHQGAGHVCHLRWTVRGMFFEAELRPSQWAAVHRFLVPSPATSMTESLVLRFLDTRKVEPSARSLAGMTRSRALGLIKWHEDGILLPYGQSRDGFDLLNPIFFYKGCEYPPGASAEPLSEWPMELLDFQGCPAPNDVYGKMFYYLRNLLVRFQRRLCRLSVSVQVSCEPLLKMIDGAPPTPQFGRPYDRIEVGDCWDLHPFLTLVSFSGLLRHHDENPFATMLVMTTDSVTRGMDCAGEDLDLEMRDLFRPTETALDELAPVLPLEETLDPRAVTRRRIGLMLWRNWDKFSARHLFAATRFAFGALLLPDLEGTHRSVLETGFLGLCLREKHIITRRWPNRLVHSKRDRPSLRDFNRHLGWADLTPQRWLEWVRFGDVPTVDRLSCMRLATSIPPHEVENAVIAAVCGPKPGSSSTDPSAGADDEGRPDALASDSASDSTLQPSPKKGAAKKEDKDKGQEKKNGKKKKAVTSAPTPPPTPPLSTTTTTPATTTPATTTPATTTTAAKKKKKNKRANKASQSKTENSDVS